jgi:hypothetical protein
VQLPLAEAGAEAEDGVLGDGGRREDRLTGVRDLRRADGEGLLVATLGVWALTNG